MYAEQIFLNGKHLGWMSAGSQVGLYMRMKSFFADSSLEPIGRKRKGKMGGSKESVKIIDNTGEAMPM